MGLTEDVLVAGFEGLFALHTNVERLTLTLAGTPQRGSSELLASDAMTRLLHEVSNRYPDRIVIFDSPPLLATTESRVLAARMGQVVVVVEAERTTHGALESDLHGSTPRVRIGALRPPRYSLFLPHGRRRSFQAH